MNPTRTWGPANRVSASPAPRGPYPLGAPVNFSAAAAPTKGWATVTALLRTTAGRPVAIGT